MIDDPLLHPCYRCRHYSNYIYFDWYTRKYGDGSHCNILHDEPFDLCKEFKIDKYFISILRGNEICV